MSSLSKSFSHLDPPFGLMIDALRTAYGDYPSLYNEHMFGQSPVCVCGAQKLMALSEEDDLNEICSFHLMTGGELCGRLSYVRRLISPELHLVKCGGIYETVGAYSHVEADIRKNTDLMSAAKLSAMHRGQPVDEVYCDISHKFRHKAADYYLLYEKQLPVSTLCASYNSAGAYISDIYTIESARGRGYATALIRTVLSECPGLSYYLLSENEQSDRLYLHTGFKKTGEYGIIRRS